MRRTGAGAFGLAAASGAAQAARDVGLKKGTPGVAPFERLKVKDPARLKLLQFTDVHFFCVRKGIGLWKDPMSVIRMQKAVEATEPDLVAVTGDLWHDDPQGRGEEFMRFGVDKCQDLGVPWLFTWGNHDKMADYAVGHEVFTNAKRSLYRGGAARGNYVVEITDAHGRPLWQLLCLNSANQGVQKEQREWLRGLVSERQRLEKPAPPAFVFFHIPIRQYKDVWDSGIASGIFQESVCYHAEDGSTLPILKELDVRACFCGHDHVNDYSGMHNGIDLVYGRVTGFGGYGTHLMKRGAKLITLNCETAEYAWESLVFRGDRWRPAPGERIEIGNRKG